MMAYVHTSAASRLLIRDDESTALVEFVNGEVELVASVLLETEIRQLARIHDTSQEAASTLLEGVTLFEQSWADHRAAGVLAGPPPTAADALHLQAAVALGVDVFLTYDVTLANLAGELGMRAAAPGR